MKKKLQAKIPLPSPPPQRTPDFISTYANNLIFEASAWDLKLIFGQLDQSSGTAVVKQHLAVTIPWPQAKLALFWLRVQIEGIETQSGKIPIRQDLIPSELPPITQEQEKDPAAKKFYQRYSELRAEFIKSL